MKNDVIINHKIHILLLLISFGFWLPFYLAFYLTYKFTNSTLKIRRQRRIIKIEKLHKRFEAIIKDETINHKFHILIVVITFGVWIPFYLGLYLFYFLTSSTIELRRAKRQTTKENRRAKRQTTKENRRAKRQTANELKQITLNSFVESRAQDKRSQPHTGYRKGGFSLISATPFNLSCSHQIRAKQLKMLGKTVWCDVCQDYRQVTSQTWTQN